MSTDNQETTTQEIPPLAHRFARLFYWCSIIFLLIGMHILIDPFNQKTETTSHIYLTLISFEIYMWILLCLGKWQTKNDLLSDTCRSGLFTLFLVGFFFFTLNELHLAQPAIATWCAVFAILSHISKLLISIKWFKWHCRSPILTSCILWIILMALTPIILSASEKHINQYGIAYWLSWSFSLFIASHILLAKWQKNFTYSKPNHALHNTMNDWTILGLLCGLSLIQLYSSMWSQFIDGAIWFYSPIFLSFALVCICLSIATKKHYLTSGFILCIAVFHTMAVSQIDPPKELVKYMAYSEISIKWIDLKLTQSIYLFVLLIVSGLTMSQPILIILAIGIPGIYGSFKFAQWSLDYKHGKGILFVIGAFITLAIGAVLQIWHEKTQRDD